MDNMTFPTSIKPFKGVKQALNMYGTNLMKIGLLNKQWNDASVLWQYYLGSNANATIEV